jgi:hypothetical protein
LIVNHRETLSGTANAICSCTKAKVTRRDATRPMITSEAQML